MKIFIVLLLFSYSIMPSFAQMADEKNKSIINVKTDLPTVSNDFNSWDIGGSIGITYPYTDISASGKRNFGIALDATKFFTHSLALQARFIHAALSGIDENKPDYRFNTTINYDLSLNGIVQFGNFVFPKHNHTLSVYASIGVGLIRYTPKVYTDGGRIVQTGIYSQYSQPLVEMDYQPTTDLLIPIGIGLKYRPAKNYSIICEYSFRTTNSDKLDGFYKLLSAEDNYSFFSVGINYHLGKHAKYLEWEDPLQSVYDDISYLKNKIELLSKDTDGDGVSDSNDREPNTLPGIKVYGDGTTVKAESFSDKKSKDESGVFLNEKINSSAEINILENVNKADSTSNNLAVIPVNKVDNTINTSNSINVPGTDIEKDSTLISKKVEEVISPMPEINPGGIAVKDTLNKSKTDSTSIFENYNNLPSIYFNSGESKITTQHYKTLDYIALVMKNHADINFNIIGVCDNIGSLQFNLELSKRRAESVKRVLEKKYFITPGRLTTNTVGSYEVNKNNNQSNRRVDIKPRK